MTPCYEYFSCRVGWRGSCRCPWPFLPAPCQDRSSCGGALKQIWEINWFKALVLLFSWAYFTGPLYCAAGLAQEQGSGGREGRIGGPLLSPLLHDSSHGIALPVLCACWKQSHGLQLTGRRGISYCCTKVQRKLAWWWTERLPLGILKGHRMCILQKQVDVPKMPCGVCIDKDIRNPSIA